MCYEKHFATVTVEAPPKTNNPNTTEEILKSAEDAGRVRKQSGTPLSRTHVAQPEDFGVTEFVRIATSPPTYRLTIAGRELRLSHEELADPRKFASAMLAQTQWALSPQDTGEWHLMLAKLFAMATPEDAPGGSGIPFGAYTIPELRLKLDDNGAIEHIVSGYVIRGHLTLFCAEPKAGKTTYTFDLVRAIVTGAPSFCGRTVTQGRVFWVDLEMGGSHIVEWASNRGLDTEDGFRTWSGHRSAIEDGTLRAAILDVKADVVVIDSWSKWTADSLGTRGEGDNPTLTREMQAIVRIARELNVAVIVIHHLRKAPGSFAEVIRGGGAIYADADIAMILFRAAKDLKDPRRRLEANGRFNDVTPPELHLTRTDGGYAVSDAADLSAADRLEPWPRWLLLSCPGGGGSWKGWQAAEVTGYGPPLEGGSLAALKRYRDGLVAQGLVVSPRRGWWERTAAGNELAAAIFKLPPA